MFQPQDIFATMSHKLLVCPILCVPTKTGSEALQVEVSSLVIPTYMNKQDPEHVVFLIQGNLCGRRTSCAGCLGDTLRNAKPDCSAGVTRLFGSPYIMLYSYLLLLANDVFKQIVYLRCLV